MFFHHFTKKKTSFVTASWIWGLLLKERICSYGSKFFLFKVRPIEKVGKKNKKNGTVAFSEKVNYYVTDSVKAQKNNDFSSD